MAETQTTAMPAALDDRKALARLRAADEDPATRQKLELIAGIARVQTSIAQRRAEMAADDALLAAMFGELEALEKREARRALALAPPAPLWLTLKEAAGLGRCSVATMKAKAKKHRFGECVDGRWRIFRDELVAYLTLGQTTASDGF
ncbi:hypothetical protein [Methylobacterium sp. 391_Methyba4]|uniref:hypothetical protein n=1 Tax=Methylobacterium sp. 391_Methyba4 TaxID=3038924 RepID=UPI00242027D9|nr:hypothetical protein [Methylobacterium sp. 391_Methyba4]WFS07625.1 hypothetical protein P9K36_30470 [Methylobacterium sp. 391_Methyba4]